MSFNQNNSTDFVSGSETANNSIGCDMNVGYTTLKNVNDSETFAANNVNTTLDNVAVSSSQLQQSQSQEQEQTQMPLLSHESSQTDSEKFKLGIPPLPVRQPTHKEIEEAEAHRKCNRTHWQIIVESIKSFFYKVFFSSLGLAPTLGEYNKN